MAEDGNHSKDHGRLKKNVSKMAFRSKEMMLRTLGRVDETKDEIIDNYVHLLNKQQTQAQKFQRELKNYMNCLNAMKTASSSFYHSINGVYEDEWSGKETISNLAQRSDQLYDDLRNKLNEAINYPLTHHSNMCNDIRFKVNKRGRKMVDFDAARRTHVAALNAKKPDEAKIAKAKEQMETSGRTYEDLNTELHNELPDLYDSRLPLYANVVATISTAENSFYGEMSEIRGRLLATVESLKNEYEKGSYHIQRLHSPVFSAMKLSTNDDSTLLCNDRLPTNSETPPKDDDDRSSTSDDVTSATDDATSSNQLNDKGTPSSSRGSEKKRSRSQLFSRSGSDYVNVQLNNTAAGGSGDGGQPEVFENGSAAAHDDDDVTADNDDVTVHRKAPVPVPRQPPPPPPAMAPPNGNELDDGDDTSDTSEDEEVTEETTPAAASKKSKKVGRLFSKMFHKQQEFQVRTSYDEDDDSSSITTTSGNTTTTAAGGGGFFSRFRNKPKPPRLPDDVTHHVPYDESPFGKVITPPPPPPDMTSQLRSAPPPPPPPPPPAPKPDDVVVEKENLYEDLFTKDVDDDGDVTDTDDDVTPSRAEASGDDESASSVEEAATGSGQAPPAPQFATFPPPPETMTSSSEEDEEEVAESSGSESDDDDKAEVVVPEVKKSETFVEVPISSAPSEVVNDDVRVEEEEATVSTNHADVTDSNGVADQKVDDVTISTNNDGIFPPHYLYTVQAQHPYTGDDEDELSFTKGDIIFVVEFPDPEEQDEGWQMGVLKSVWDNNSVTNASMGLFPENFTKKI